ncbi:NHLP leader peptide family natural product precursor [Rhizobium ruizarguesonis]|uniref:NHLP leader peptide family RiPP precursor n=2 Tax=Rhizobium ruizarguesonis TaxID=2081791 RepID=UPI00102FF7AD|nr:NHLP leader peptide family RiPP precursor [Rhizobium ruizarguesonis]TAU15502.1 NHLP leader peptide family natural product precursor [Rhizobium ruizarguesonis]
MDQEEKRQKIFEAWAQLVVRAWLDDKFKDELIKHPKRYLKELGVEFASKIRVAVVAETPNKFALHLPNKPDGFDSGDAANIKSLDDMITMSSFGVCDDMVFAIKDKE